MKKIRETILHKGKYLSLIESVFLNRDGKEMAWESVIRKNRRKVVVIVPKLIPSNRYVLIRQFRHAIDNYVLGFPAGITESDDLIHETLRELKEETGYKGGHVDMSPSFKLSPAVIDDDVHIATVEIDEKDPQNIKPVQALEPDEIIEVILAKKEEIRPLIDSELKAGNTVASALWYLII
jgi:ADP-ribose pyrophosphatase